MFHGKQSVLYKCEDFSRSTGDFLPSIDFPAPSQLGNVLRLAARRRNLFCDSLDVDFDIPSSCSNQDTPASPPNRGLTSEEMRECPTLSTKVINLKSTSRSENQSGFLTASSRGTLSNGLGPRNQSTVEIALKLAKILVFVQTRIGRCERWP